MIPLSRVSLVIPVYNQLVHTMQCLESILRQPDKVDEIIVVDNASTDGTPEYLKGIPGVTVIRNATNLGCAMAYNQGIRASRSEIVGMLSNDTVVPSGWLPALLRFMEQTGHGIVSPAAREGRLDYDLEHYATEFVRRCAGATRPTLYGACILVKREVFDKIGLFDEAFRYGGCEDVDFLWRAQRAGITAAVTGSALIHHFGMVTQNAVKSTESKAYPAQNLAHFHRKWGRTVRGNWLQRRWARFKEKWTERYERFRYGHTLVEKSSR